jgi:hypothetical protein
MIHISNVIPVFSSFFFYMMMMEDQKDEDIPIKKSQEESFVDR